jgi:GT2 family glycosyltransferase
LTYPTVSIIILNYNSKEYLANCLDSVKKLEYPNYEVIVVDNASTDGSVSYVQNNLHSIRLIKNLKNLGYAKANNEAAKEANGEFLLFLNADTWIKPNLLNELVSTITINPNAGVCCCTQLSYDGTQRLNSGLTTDLFAYPLEPTNQEKILYSDGASLFVKRFVFEQVGGFDPAYFMYGEDVDLGWRILLAGYDIVVAKSAIVGHKSPGTLASSGKKYYANKLRRYLAERNSFRTLLKNYSALTLLYILPLRSIIMIQVTFFFLIRRSDFAIVEINAVFWNLKKLKETFALRYVVQKNRKVPDRLIMLKMGKIIGLARSFVAIQQNSLGINWGANKI